jgi:hypothetical protein
VLLRVERPVIRLRPARARSVLGMDVDARLQRQLLESIACGVEEAGYTLAVTPPAYRPDLVIEETMNSVGIGGRRITVERVHIERTARSQGASRPAKFAPNGSQVLLDRCSVQADNVWFIATGARVPGPIVILNADFHGDSRVE